MASVTRLLERSFYIDFAKSSSRLLSTQASPAGTEDEADGELVTC